MTCQQPKPITLANGTSCCTDCKRYLVECEARALLRLPLEERRAKLDKLEKRRGSVEALKQAMTTVHNAQINRK